MAPRIQRLGPRLVMITTRHGERDYHRVCLEHTWASRESVDPNHLPECPDCQVDLDRVHGRERYEALNARLLKEQMDDDARDTNLVGPSGVLDDGRCRVRS